jgi:large subunit ribosomal protein L21
MRRTHFNRLKKEMQERKAAKIVAGRVNYCFSETNLAKVWGNIHRCQLFLTPKLSLCIITGFPDSARLFSCAAMREKSLSNYSMRFHMYAVIKTGGKQYKVVAGEKLKIEQIPADIGSEITLDQVLALGAGETVTFGEPLVAGATVLATVLAQGRHDKVKIFKMRRRKHYQKHQGHRQNYTEVQIVSINA